ncbi:DegQ family serine endoprotease [Methylotuvimicrobium alcaliphilum]|uniref:Serine protease do-like n=1 Tax=Methylotuvimicrobium alcaliphilum (strain DSM 19304 / NCIMB 14124 / VKM B-2133 / 20Z) TaxID=1091494 RepID=G4SXU4_META2|nr:DegQ family serine endoprotease [Methylotuvimicrobium alcaliphilum]CCE23138.1 putative serine protease do-like [Methylotuvimicrobium alcaliphilum 20Z]
MNKKYFLPLLLLIVTFSPLSFAQTGGIENLRETSKAFASVARQASPSVVFIQVESSREGVAQTPFATPFGDEWPFGDDFFRRFFGDEFPGTPRRPGPAPTPQQRAPAIGQGSGFVFASKRGLLSETSYIITNNHVVANADKIRVTFQDGREFVAKITGTDPKSDIAVIEIKAGNLPALPLGDSTKLEVGEWVVAIGNPFGLSHTLTVGVVSAKGRTSLGISDYEDFIQTDAAINPGNSGGPLVNLDGEAVGINTAIFSRSGGHMGVGFAIPINLAKSIADQLIEQGEVTRGYLGVVIQPLTQELAESFNLTTHQGILIAQVTDDSPAAKAGLKAGDIVTQYQGRPVNDIGDFRNRVALTPPGKSAKIEILRDGKSRTIDIKIEKLGDQQIAAAQAPAQSTEELGLTVQTVTRELARQFNATPGQGVIVTEVNPGSIAAMAGIRPGTVILQVDRKPVNSANEFNRAVNQSKDNKRVLLLISDRGMSRYVVLQWR